MFDSKVLQRLEPYAIIASEANFSNMTLLKKQA